MIDQKIEACPFPGCGGECCVFVVPMHGWALRCGCGYHSQVKHSKAKAIAAHNENARATEAGKKLPKTMDEVYVTPGMELWRMDGDRPVKTYAAMTHQNTSKDTVYKVIGESCSTHESAIAAAQEPRILVALGDTFADACSVCKTHAYWGLASTGGPDGCREAVKKGQVFCDVHIPPGYKPSNSMASIIKAACSKGVCQECTEQNDEIQVTGDEE